MKALTTAFFIISFIFAGNSQSINELQKQKLEAVREIEYTTRLLKETQRNQTASLDRLNLLNRQITRRNDLIANIHKEIILYQSFIDANSSAIQMLTEDVENIKKEYAAFIRSAYRNKNAGNKAIFLLSAENFNQAYRRLLYLKRYSANRYSQSEAIGVIQDVLGKNIAKLAQQKKIKELLVGETKNETLKLSTEKVQQNKEVQNLQKKQKSLMQKLREQKQIEQRLENDIQRIIEEEARKSGAPVGKSYAMTPEQKLIGDNFEQNKSRLPWPVERGAITERFGINPHPVLTHVEVKNNGVNITTEPGAKVRAVFNGEVTRVFGITGGNSSIIIRHGLYLSVYSNLKEVIVKKGDKVTTRQVIGTVFTESEDGNSKSSVLKFQIWRDKQKLDPEDWISR